MATVATLPLALVVWSKPGSTKVGPTTKPSVALNAVPAELLVQPPRAPGPFTADTSCKGVDTAKLAKIPATTIFFLPVVFLAISDTTT